MAYLRCKRLNFNIVLLVFSVVAGVFSGIFRLRFFSEADVALLAAGLHQFVAEFNSAAIGWAAFAESLLRYGRPLVLIWACAAIPKAYYAAFLVVYLRALTLGFSAALMVVAFDGRGFVMALALYAVQNLIAMPMYGYTIYFMAKNPLAPNTVKHAVKVAVMGVLAVSAAVIIEIYITPILFDLL